MNISKILVLTSSGKELTEKETDILAQHLGVKTSGTSIFLRVMLVVLTVGAGFLYALKMPFLGTMVVTLLVLDIFHLIYKSVHKEKYIIEYLEAIKEYYLNRFKDYEGFETAYLKHQYQRNGYLQNDLCILVTDGYDFYIFDDMLKETEHTLPKKFKSKNNKYPVLKIFDGVYSTKRPVYFKLSEIEYYKLVGEYEPEEITECLGDDYKRYTFSSGKYELTNYVDLELTDHSTFKLSADAIDILRRKAKGKEHK